jgi:cell pole-organizing protein PopZ
MSSTERAPEPTMEDILASIRRIITDDDTGKAPADKAAAQSEDEGLEGEADNQIIDDIARVLTSGGDAPANEDEEIMDLTGELGGLELVEDEPEEILETLEVVDTTPEFVEVSEDSEELLALDDVQPDILEPDVIEADMPEAAVEVIETVEMMETVEVAEFAEPEEMELPAEEAPAPEMPSMTPPPLPEPAAEAAPAEAAPEAPQLSASEEAATALERAIAALKAGQSPSSAPEPAASPASSFGAPAASAEPEAPEAQAAEETPIGVIPLPTDIPIAVPMDSPTPETETHPDPDAESVAEMAEGAAEWEPFAEDELVLMDTESEATMVLEDAEPEQETESTPFWPPQDTATAEPEPAPAPVFGQTAAEVAQGAVAAGTNGAASHERTGGKSLEDSIKEMLRPMLREWLNENMPRMIREELDSDALQRGQD